MDSILIYICLIGFAFILYILYRLKRLEDLIRGYKLKNQEGAGALSKSRSPLYLFLAFICFIPVVLDWFVNGFNGQRLILILPSFLMAYLYVYGDNE